MLRKRTISWTMDGGAGRLTAPIYDLRLTKPTTAVWTIGLTAELPRRGENCRRRKAVWPKTQLLPRRGEES